MVGRGPRFDIPAQRSGDCGLLYIGRKIYFVIHLRGRVKTFKKLKKG